MEWLLLLGIILAPIIAFITHFKSVIVSKITAKVMPHVIGNINLGSLLGPLMPPQTLPEAKIVLNKYLCIDYTFNSIPYKVYIPTSTNIKPKIENAYGVSADGKRTDITSLITKLAGPFNNWLDISLPVGDVVRGFNSIALLDENRNCTMLNNTSYLHLQDS